MTRGDRLSATLASHYPDATIGQFATSDHACAFVTSQPLQDPDTNGFRSAAAQLNELAVAHRLSMAFACGAFGLAPDSGFAIKSLSCRRVSNAFKGLDRYELVLRSSLGQRRAATELGATLTRWGQGACHKTNLIFTVMPAAVVRFVRRERGFANYHEAAVEGTGTVGHAGLTGELIYSPSETDRLLEGARTDHIPALVLIDIIVSTVLHDRPPPNLLVQFTRYIDPRIPFSMQPCGHGATVTVYQGGMLVACMTQGSSGGDHSAVAGDQTIASSAIPAAMAPAKNTEA